MNDIKDIICKEIKDLREKVGQKGTLSRTDLDDLHKLLHTEHLLHQHDEKHRDNPGHHGAGTMTAANPY